MPTCGSSLCSLMDTQTAGHRKLQFRKKGRFSNNIILTVSGIYSSVKIGLKIRPEEKLF